MVPCEMVSIMWFRHDLRLSDNHALSEAAKIGPVIPVYIDDPAEKIGDATRLWLQRSLSKLGINAYSGNSAEVLRKIVELDRPSHVFWNRSYDPWRRKSDKSITDMLTSMNVKVATFNSFLLWEPEDVLKSDGTPYKVFTPFYKKGCLSLPEPRKPIPRVDPKFVASKLHPTFEHRQDKWHGKITWEVGEDVAQNRLAGFLEHGLNGYKNGRNFPASNHVSRLSPHLHFGEISPHQVYYAAKGCDHVDSADRDHFLSELAWREFSYYLLYHFPELPEKNFQDKFDVFPWRYDERMMNAWRRGKTGYPIVDAGMRELWETGYMHNRVRMIVASFLVKNLRIHWHYGRDWFWDCLLDADLANNSASWQWVAGSGADAAPYFRIFNPVLQAEKFDPDGAYIRKYVPELSRLPKPHIFAPWDAPQDLMRDVDYPAPIVDMDESRKAALDAYMTLKAPHD